MELSAEQKRDVAEYLAAYRKKLRELRKIGWIKTPITDFERGKMPVELEVESANSFPAIEDDSVLLLNPLSGSEVEDVFLSAHSFPAIEDDPVLQANPISFDLPSKADGAPIEDDWVLAVKHALM